LNVKTKRTGINIFALVGKGKTGKTTTLSLLIDLLSKKAARVKSDNGNKDKQVVICIDGKHIGITTKGDDAEALNKALEKIFELEKALGIDKCDLYVCACRSKGDCHDYLEQATSNAVIRKYGQCYVYTEESCADLRQKAVNEIMAKMLYEEIIDFLKIANI